MGKKIKIVILGLIIIVCAKLWLGIYAHDEFGSKHVFIKQRPIWKTYFYSPQGMSDLRISDLTTKKQKEQLLFNEFISTRGLSR